MSDTTIPQASTEVQKLAASIAERARGLRQNRCLELFDGVSNLIDDLDHDTLVAFLNNISTISLALEEIVSIAGYIESSVTLAEVRKAGV